MARTPSFHLPPEEWRDPFALSGGEAHHLARVLRLAPGAAVRLFDGRGREADAVVAEVGRHKALLTLLAERTLPPEPDRPVLAVGFTRSERRQWLLEKAVELEAGAVWFFRAERSQGSVPEAPKPAWAERLVGAAKQCANPWLPELATLPGGIPELAARVAALPEGPRLLLDPDGPRLDPAQLAGKPAVIALGPEGGLTDAEREAFLLAGFAPASLGGRVLRHETAALLALGLTFHARHADKS